MRVYFDSEFTGLHQNTTLISIAFVAENGKKLYIEFTDYDRTQINEWIQANVIDNLWSTIRPIPWQEDVEYYFLSKKEAVHVIRDWFSNFEDEVEMWGDCLAYDWMLFCELFGGAMYIPNIISYIPLDLSTLMAINGIDPDVSRKELSKFNGNQHNALSDATMIKLCYEYIESYYL